MNVSSVKHAMQQGASVQSVRHDRVNQDAQATQTKVSKAGHEASAKTSHQTERAHAQTAKPQASATAHVEKTKSAEAPKAAQENGRAESMKRMEAQATMTAAYQQVHQQTATAQKPSATAETRKVSAVQ